MTTLSDSSARLDILPAEVPRRQPAMPQRYIACGVILILGILISITAFRFTQTFYLSEARNQFERMATQVNAILGQSIARYSDSVRSIRNFYGASEDVTREEFARFVEPTLRQFPAIQALEWIPKVDPGDRADFEWAARRDGLLDFTFSEIGSDQTLTPAGSRSAYYPVYFLEPLDRNRRAAGFDLASDPTRLAALIKARDSGKAVATQRIPLLEETSTQSAFLLFVPIYRNGMATNTVAQRRAALHGFGLGVFRIGDMIANTLNSAARLTGLDVYLFDDSAPASERFLAYVPTPRNTGNPVPLTERALHETHVYSASHDIGGRTWKFVISPAPGYFSGEFNLPFGVLGAGLLVTAGIALAVLSGCNRIYTAECLVDQRTVELRDMLQELTKSKTALLKSKIEKQEAKQRLLDALEVSPSGLILFDKNDRLVLFNSTAKRMSQHLGRQLKPGMKYSEYARLDLESQYPEASSSEIDKELAAKLKKHRKLLKEGTPTTFERKIGPDLWIQHTDNRTVDGGSIGILNDITDLKKTHENLELQTQELKRSNEELEQFAYLASHDMQEPLRVIASFCDLLQMRYADKLDDDGKEFIAYAVDGARRMRSLLDDLLTYSRVGRSEIKITPVPLMEVLTEIQSRLSSVIEEEGAELTFDELPTVKGDQTLLTQLLQNLVGNGIKFHGDAPPKVYVSAETGTNFWTISVSDNGIGIEPQFADKVFQMFQRLHGSDAYPGNGLGLALCKRAVERHGGTIWIEPAETSGTTIKFTLPV
jgi:signal transduction histidine kinase/CHASE1-domain containing sensor protein